MRLISFFLNFALPLRPWKLFNAIWIIIILWFRLYFVDCWLIFSCWDKYFKKQLLLILSKTFEFWAHKNILRVHQIRTWEPILLRSCLLPFYQFIILIVITKKNFDNITLFWKPKHLCILSYSDLKSHYNKCKVKQMPTDILSVF